MLVSMSPGLASVVALEYAIAPLQLAEVPPWLRAWLDSEWALVVLLGVFVLEGAMLMYFMPSELVVPSALLLIGTAPEDVAAVLTVAVVGATIGQYALFRVAHHGGREYLLQKRWFRISESTLDRFDGWFDRWGPVVIPVSNTLLFTRGMLTVPAGLSDMSGQKFVVLSAIGTLSFQSILAALFLWFETLLA
ncbi:putative membrane-associated protein, DedA family [Halalkaliarchaeum sp. AArc-CO]|nr:putative membrane-associated protein, DedA family [Halalkaliarchaeum sp. AArc-CO]